MHLQHTVDVAVAWQAGLLGGRPVVVLSAALTMGPVGVVSAAHTAPPAAGAAVLLGVEHALVRPPTAVALCRVRQGEETGGRERERDQKGQVRRGRGKSSHRGRRRRGKERGDINRWIRN